MSVSIGGLDFENTFFNGEEGYIESTTTEIKDQNILFLGWLFVQTIGNSGSSGFIDNSKYV